MEILIIVLVILLVCWSLFWTGYALWTSARMGHRKWFIIFMLVHTLGILEIIYLQFVAKKTPRDVGFVFKTRI